MPRPDAPSLQLVQQGFLDAVRGDAFRAWAGAAGPFVSPPAGEVERRFAIYATGYVARLAEALENDYPAVRRILGAGPFGSLAARYVSRHPPRSYDIGRAGDRLADHLEDDPLSSDLPFLPDLARYEWALAEAFVAPDSEPLAWSDLAALGPEAVADATFRLRPGTTLVRSSWPLLALWGAQDLADEDVSIPLVPSPSTVLVHRAGLDVRRRLVGEADARFLEEVAGGLRLSDLLDGVSGEAEAGDLVERFRLWVVNELFEKTRDAAGVPFQGEER
jgi:hypothetical protein